MNQAHSLIRRVVQHGLLAFSPEDRPFPGRHGTPPSEAIMDIRGASSNLPLRSLLLEGLLNALAEFPPNAVIAGLSRGGLVLGAQLALQAERPFVAVLPEGPRASGLQRAVEGKVTGSQVILFDNVISSGDSLRAAALYVAEAGGTVAGALVLGAYETLPSLPFQIRVLFEFRSLIDAALEAGIVNTARRNKIMRSIR